MRVFVLDWNGPLPRPQQVGELARRTVPLRALGLDAVVTFVAQREELGMRDEEVPTIAALRLAEMACIA